MMRKFVVLLILAFVAMPARADITLGVSAPLTGPAAGVNEVSLPGLKQAVTDVNAKSAEKIKLEILDDACDPKQAVQAANKLISLNVAAVISISCSGSTSAAAPLYDEEGMPFLAAVASAPELTKQGYKTLFRPASRDDQDAAAGADFIAQKFAGKSVAVIDDKGTWGKGISTLVVAELKAKGFATVDTYSLNVGEADFSALISRLKAKKYDVVYPALMMREAGLLIRQMSEQHYQPAVVGSVTLAMPDFLAIVGPAKKGLYFTLMQMSPRAEELQARLAGPGKKPDLASVYNVQAYAAVEILAQALAKSTKPAAVVKSLQTDRFDTALGPISFAPNGDIAEMKFAVWQHTAGDPQLVK